MTVNVVNKVLREDLEDVDDELGPEMSKATAISKVEKFYPASALKNMEEELKWGDKVEGLQALSKQVS
jgi:hypothetical protein